MSAVKKASLRDIMLSQTTLRTTTVQVPGVGEVRLRELNGAQRDELAQLFFDARVPDPNNPGGFINRLPAHYREKMIVKSVIDEAGNLVFTEDDVERLAQLHSQRVLDHLQEAIQDMSQLDADAVEGAMGN